MSADRNDWEDAMETRMALVLDKLDRLVTANERLTEELRHTNDSLTTVTFAVKATQERQDRLERELFTPDNASRVRSLELHVKGLYGLFLFIAMSLVAQFIWALWHVPVGQKP